MNATEVAVGEAPGNILSPLTFNSQQCLTIFHFLSPLMGKKATVIIKNASYVTTLKAITKF